MKRDPLMGFDLCVVSLEQDAFIFIPVVSIHLGVIGVRFGNNLSWLKRLHAEVPSILGNLKGNLLGRPHLLSPIELYYLWIYNLFVVKPCQAILYSMNMWSDHAE